MAYDLPGKKTKAFLHSCKSYFKHGLTYELDAKRSNSRGFKPPAQIMLDRAKGDHIWDLDGNKFIDFQNGWATNPLGNCHPEILEAVRLANERYGYHWEHPLRFELAEKLADIMPGKQLSRFTYEVSGTEAVESAVHTALCFKKRRYVVSFASSFHGASLATKMISGYTSEHNIYMEPWDGSVVKAPYPHSENIPAGMSHDQYVDYCLWHLDYHIPEYIVPSDNIAAVLIEPGLAEGGNWIPSKKFIEGIRKICNKHGWLMIADEVLTGLGRTAKMWGIDHYDVIPDMLIVGKNLSGGIAPCAGVATRDEILGNNPSASSGSTFAGTPAGCAAGLKTLEIYQRDSVIDHAKKLSEIAKNRMAEWVEKYSIVSEVRQLGLLMGISFAVPDNDKIKEGWDNSFIARTVRDQMLRNGVWAICDSESTVRMYPALNMAEKVFSEAFDIIESAIIEVDSGAVLVGDYPAVPTGVTGF
jgi:4-aminobutyrate aminotransferase-like enzyme